MRSDRCDVRRFRRCANVIECTYTNLDSIAYYTQSIWYTLLFLGYKTVQHVTVLNTVGNCNTMVSIIILYHNTIILWDRRRICGPSLTETSLCGAYLCMYMYVYKKVESKGLPQQAEVALGVPGRLRPRIFSTFGTTRVVGRQPNAPAAFTPGDLPGTHFQRLSRPQSTWFCRKEPRKKS